MNRFTLIAVFFFASVNVHAAQPKIMGAGSCASSHCHGSLYPLDTSSVSQQEFTIWNKRDAHSKAWKVLTQEDGKRIGRHLGIEKPEKAPECLACHATYVDEALLAVLFMKKV